MQEVFDIQRVALESRRRRNRQLRLLIPVFVLATAAAIGESIGFIPGPIVDVDYVYWSVAVLVFGGLAYTLANWRCPVCEKSLWYRLNPKFCPKCGQALDSRRSRQPNS
jgi:hypothetical protein